MANLYKLVFTFLLILLVFGVVFAQNETKPPECIKEGKSFPIYPGYGCCDGLTAIKPTSSLSSTGECVPIVGSSVCSNCGNGTCESWENQCNCKEDCSPTCLSCCKEDSDCKKMVWRKFFMQRRNM